MNLDYLGAVIVFGKQLYIVSTFIVNLSQIFDSNFCILCKWCRLKILENTVRPN